MKKQTYDTSSLHCVQCHRELEYKVDIADSLVSICFQPDCPNFSLLQIPLEQTPRAKKYGSTSKK